MKQQWMISTLFIAAHRIEDVVERINDLLKEPENIIQLIEVKAGWYVVYKSKIP